MGYLGGIDSNSDDYVEKYRQFGKEVLANAKLTTSIALGKNIEVFPTPTDSNDSGENNGNTNSCVIIQNAQQNNTTQFNVTQKQEKPKKRKNDASWIREALPSIHDNTSMASTISNSIDVQVAKGMDRIGNAIDKVDNNNDSGNTDNNNSNYESFDESDLFDLEGNGDGIEEMFNSNDDEGSGKDKLLKTFFEKQVKKGFCSNNFVGSKYKKDVTNSTSDMQITAYTDDSLCTNDEKTTFIFGGTVNKSYSKSDETKKSVDYNVYGYLKHIAKNFTFGGGAIHVNNDGVKNTDISFGAMENSTGIHVTIQKAICSAHGLPTYKATNVSVGIAPHSSGLLNPEEYNPKNSDIEEISDIDEKESFVEGKQSNLYNPEDSSADGSKNPIPNSSIDLIFENTDNHKEYGIKGAQIFRFTTKNNNYAFVQPFGKISNTVVDSNDGGSNEGITLLLGANAGQNITFGNGWNLKTKGLIEISRKAIEGNKPSDSLIANAKFIAENKKFKGELGIGTFVDNAKNFCRYMETKVGYEFNKYLSAYLKAGTAKYRLDGENNNQIFEFAVGAHCNL